MKEMREVANLGTPWSGHEVKWYWVTFRASPSDVCYMGYQGPILTHPVMHV
jgi:hypothetical protein